MESPVELTITILVDTEQALQDVAEFKSYAMQVLDDIKSAYASLSVSAPSGDEESAAPDFLTGDPALKRRV